MDLQPTPAAALLVVVALALGVGAGWALRRLLAALARRTPGDGDDHLVVTLRGPLELALAAYAARELEPRFTHEAVDLGVATGLLLAVAGTWWGLRAADRLGGVLQSAAKGQGREALAAAVPLGVKVLRFFALFAGGALVLSALGVEVGSVLAGLGLGGVALAFAAQKTVENLFGAVALAVDQPFHVGDFVRLGDVVGLVETIGLRSTRVRTLDRTVVSLPNAKVADGPIENYSLRDRGRLNVVVALPPDTPAPGLGTACAVLEARLAGEGLEGVTVRVTAVTAVAVEVTVSAPFGNTDPEVLGLRRHDVLLAALGALRRAE